MLTDPSWFAPLTTLSLRTPLFEVLLPSGTTRATSVVETAAGRLEVTDHAFADEGQFLSLSWVEYPPEFERGTTAAEALDSAREGALANVNGELVRELPLSFEAGSHRRWPARELMLTTPHGEVVRLLLVLAGRTLVQVVVARVAGAADRGLFAQVCDSLRFRSPSRPLRH